MYKILLYKPDGTIEESHQKNKPDLAQLQSAVGGLIETVPHLIKIGEHKRGTAFINEESQLENMPFNPMATMIWLNNLGPGPFRYPPRLYGNMIYYCKVKEQK